MKAKSATEIEPQEVKVRFVRVERSNLMPTLLFDGALSIHHAFLKAQPADRGRVADMPSRRDANSHYRVKTFALFN
jgi:hypothetical protein